LLAVIKNLTLEKEEVIKILEEFKIDIQRWDSGGLSTSKSNQLRSKINKKKAIIEKIITQTGASNRFDYYPPPMIGGFTMKGINPFDVFFDPPYKVNVVNMISDSIDQAIGVIESKETFLIENKRKTNISKPNKPIVQDSKKVFIVHGHDNELKEKSARFLEKIGLEPIILHEQVNGGLTIIEKFELNSEVQFAIILMTPDDVGSAKGDTNNLNPRARQNVILELGYFMGKLGRNKVCALIKSNIERPSDYDGVIYIAIDNSDGWKLLLVKELKQAGLVFDSNKIF
jgi:predicted nucleotide-binding protein